MMEQKNRITAGNRRMRMVGRRVCVVRLWVLIWGLAISPGAVAEPEQSYRWAQTSQANVYQVEVRPEDGKPPIGKMHRWIVTVMTPEAEPVRSARIQIGGGMPGHGHGLPTQPQVVATDGAGSYLFDGLRFSMEGLWRLSIFIESEYGNDRADFEIRVEF